MVAGFVGHPDALELRAVVVLREEESAGYFALTHISLGL